MKLITALAVGVLATGAAPLPEEAPLYRVSATVPASGGTETMTTTVALPGRAEIVSTGADPHRMVVELNRMPGAEPQIYLEANNRRVAGAQGDIVSHPHLVFREGATGRIEIGEPGTPALLLVAEPTSATTTE